MSRSPRRSYKLSFDGDENRFTLHAQGELLRFLRIIVRSASRAEIERPPVPRANDLAVFHQSLRKWAASVNADVVERTELAVSIGNAHGAAGNRKLPRFTVTREFIRFAQEVFRHRS